MYFLYMWQGNYQVDVSYLAGLQCLLTDLNFKDIFFLLLEGHWQI